MSLRRIIFLTSVFVTFGYFLFEARGVLFAPPLFIYEPQNNTTFRTTRIHVAGKTDPGLHVSVGGRSFIADDQGDFDDFITINPGYNEIGFLVKDRFGNETQRVLKVVVE